MVYKPVAVIGINRPVPWVIIRWIHFDIVKIMSKHSPMLAVVVVVAAIFVIPSGNGAIASPSNCASVYKSYPFGIALNKQSVGTSRAEVNRKKYIQLKYLDKDLDGIVCEIERLQIKVPVSVTTPRTTATTTTTIPLTTTTTTIPLTTTTQSGCWNSGKCYLGDRGPGGGIVFYKDGVGAGRYLEAAPSDLGMMPWNDAINAARGYTGGGLSDWRLPTKDELNSLYFSRRLVGGFLTSSYWTSSEVDCNCAWVQFFGTGTRILSLKNLETLVRPVRAFG